ncbi:MAG: DUF2945 domain-containing protein [Micrococcales bacterium]|nr:DUF2945 domain-containing protein [Micrococcales bacterium]
MAKASAGEMRLLRELRAKELANVPNAEFAIIEREVQANGFKGIKGTTAQLVFNAIRKKDKAEKEMKKAKSVQSGDIVSWQSSGGKAQGKVIRVVSNGKINVPNSSFTIAGTEDDPAVLIQLYRDGKPTDTKVGHKMSTLNKSLVEKHGSHDQSSHGAWANGKYNPDDSEGEDALEPKNYRTHPKFHSTKDDSEGEFEDLNYDDPRWMDDMDILRPSRITPSQRYTTSAKELRDRLIAMESRTK